MYVHTYLHSTQKYRQTDRPIDRQTDDQDDIHRKMDDVQRETCSHTKIYKKTYINEYISQGCGLGKGRKKGARKKDRQKGTAHSMDGWIDRDRVVVVFLDRSIVPYKQPSIHSDVLASSIPSLLLCSIHPLIRYVHTPHTHSVHACMHAVSLLSS